ncbi:sugar ABC transporter substrate-binding protein [Halocella sp. SP3-1]|uniref:ABC transporter substrate-binding protein n=1 Tax=Halocella sp. SP3-1 TaxID=2382161 RepID=UPI000F76187F|nr:sugar ABC transporter substrate-binding protein [Halocella sp. SP3-1]AZO94278.1 sugar ABC transporter substrate-binding protein [Halocella sp. SP3-1]
MKKELVVLCTVILIVGLFSGVINAKEEITVWVGGHIVAQEDLWEDIISNFEEQEGVRVDYQLIGFDVYFDRLVVAFKAGQGPDVTFADLGGWVPTFAANGWLEPMDNQLANWNGTNEIWENLWPTVEYKGHKYGLPWYTDCRLLLYNKKMFRKAGLDPSKPPKTWDELLNYAQILTDQGNRVYGYGVSGKKTEVSTLGYIMFLFANNGKLLNDDYSQAAFNTSEGIKALKFYTDLYKKYKVSPSNTLAYGEDEYRNMMAQNKVAMAIGGPWSFPLIEKANPDIKDEYAVALHPYNTKPASVFGGWASVISKQSKNKGLAWKFIKYITSYEVWDMWIKRSGGPLPARRDVAEDSPVFKDSKWQVVLQTFPTAGFRPPIPEYPEVSNVIQTMIQNVLLGKQTAKEAIALAEIEVNYILSK